MTNFLLLRLLMTRVILSVSVSLKSFERTKETELASVFSIFQIHDLQACLPWQVWFHYHIKYFHYIHMYPLIHPPHNLPQDFVSCNAIIFKGLLNLIWVPQMLLSVGQSTGAWATYLDSHPERKLSLPLPTAINSSSSSAGARTSCKPPLTMLRLCLSWAWLGLLHALK